MHRNIPNQLTVLRLVLAALFFIVLNSFRYPDHNSWALLAAIGIFIVATITDALDGYLARLWQAESTFGRIMDPFCDKVLVIGAFIYLSGPRMVDPAAVEKGFFLNMASGVYPWMVAVILARELLVTNIRGELEESGVRFPALYLGKLKMILQSVTVPILLLIVHYQPGAYQHTTLNILRDTLVYTTVVVTVLSGVPYVTKAVRVVRGRA
jgi:CDP-diacylglycerol---glycerol-3-phosphate 3-phosphatidyltransferase